MRKKLTKYIYVIIIIIKKNYLNNLIKNNTLIFSNYYAVKYNC